MLSIPIASYCSIKRLVLDHLFLLKFTPLINLIGITILKVEYSKCLMAVDTTLAKLLFDL
ncbi:MAG TPA: hypothetical protein DEO86_08070 [Colwellia sp.]|nr:hypothetical protein [Colwellia sp.]